MKISGLHPALRSSELILAADVDNPLTGPNGAAEVYGPQKGASPAQVAELAAGLRRWAAVVAAAVGAGHSLAPGSGAGAEPRRGGPAAAPGGGNDRPRPAGRGGDQVSRAVTR
jgi:glycerate kinase